MHAVGDGADGHVLHRVLVPDAVPHFARDHAVELGHTIVEPRELERQHGHAEMLGVVARVLPAKGQEHLEGQAQAPGVILEIGLDEVGRKTVVAGRHRGVGRENRARGHELHSRLEGQLVLVHEIGDALKAREGRMALVHVDDLGLEAKRLQGPDAADAEEVFLADPGLQVAAVEAVGELARGGLVFRYVGVHEVERHPADLRLPDLGEYPFPAQVHVDHDPFAGRVLAQGQRHLLEVVDGVAFLLPAVRGEVLAEKTLLVAQADADQGHAQVACRLEMVAGQDAESPGIDGQALGDAVFQAEIGHQRRVVAVRKGNGAGLPGQIGAQLLEQVLHPVDEKFIPGQGFQGPLGQAVEKSHRIAVAFAPEFAVNLGKKRHDVVVPGKKQIIGQFPKRFELGRQFGHHTVHTQWLHTTPRGHHRDMERPRAPVLDGINGSIHKARQKARRAEKRHSLDGIPYKTNDFI